MGDSDFLSVVWGRFSFYRRLSSHLRMALKTSQAKIVTVKTHIRYSQVNGSMLFLVKLADPPATQNNSQNTLTALYFQMFQLLLNPYKCTTLNNSWIVKVFSFFLSFFLIHSCSVFVALVALSYVFPDTFTKLNILISCVQDLITYLCYLSETQVIEWTDGWMTKHLFGKLLALCIVEDLQLMLNIQ